MKKLDGTLNPSVFLFQSAVREANPMTSAELKARTKQFALRVLKLVDALPANKVSAQTIARQLGKSGTSVAANYRAACRAKSPADF